MIQIIIQKLMIGVFTRTDKRYSDGKNALLSDKIRYQIAKKLMEWDDR